MLAADRVRHVGDGAAFVVAETLEQAVSAAHLVAVDYEVLPARTEPRAGLPEASIWPEAPDNVAFEWRFGDAATCRRLFDRAAPSISAAGSATVTVGTLPRAAVMRHVAHQGAWIEGAAQAPSRRPMLSL